MENRVNLEKKILYRSNYRGCKETDLLIGKFAKSQIKKLDLKELEAFLEILDEDDGTLYKIITQKINIPKRYLNSSAMKKLIEFNEDKIK